MIVTATVLLATGVVKLYDLVVAMTLGGPGIATEVPAKFVMDHLFERNNIGLATAAATMHAGHGRRRAGALGLCALRPAAGEATHDRAVEPAGPPPAPPHRRPHRRLAFLVIAALFFLLPLWIMVVTSLKPMDEIRLGNILALPATLTFDAWIKAWSSACTGLECNGISVGFWNSVRILIPSVILSIVVGAVNGYALSFWRVQRRQRHVRHPAARRLHPLPGLPLSAGAHLLA